MYVMMLRMFVKTTNPLTEIFSETAQTIPVIVFSLYHLNSGTSRHFIT